MQSTKPKKAKRILKDISFEGANAHLALCSKEQGVANQADYALVLKGADISEESLQKMQQVKVTMELPAFLERFFYLWEGDAKVLATLLGYVEPMDTAESEKEEQDKELQDWIESKMSAFEIVKSLKGLDNQELLKALSGLSSDNLLALLQDQELVEKALASSAKDIPANAGVAPQIVDEVKGEASASDLNKSKDKETKMQDEVQETVETIEKSAYVALEKALEDQKVELAKALETVAKYEQEKKEQIAKARKEALVQACGDKADVLFKAVADADEQVFADVVKALAAMQAQVEKSALFQEQGAAVEETTEQESAVTKLIKAKFQK